MVTVVVTVVATVMVMRMGTALVLVMAMVGSGALAMAIALVMVLVVNMGDDLERIFALLHSSVPYAQTLIDPHKHAHTTTRSTHLRTKLHAHTLAHDCAQVHICGRIPRSRRPTLTAPRAHTHTSTTRCGVPCFRTAFRAIPPYSMYSP